MGRSRIAIASAAFSLVVDGGPAAAGPDDVASSSRSPFGTSSTELGPVGRSALQRCGQPDEALQSTARWVLARKRTDGVMPDAEALSRTQRAFGEPHPWARAWSAQGGPIGLDATWKVLDEWLAEEGEPRLRRCGVADGLAQDGAPLLVVVAVDALADMAPLPTRGRTGQWLTVRACLRTVAHGASVIVLGPTGPPRALRGWFDEDILTARFALDEPGEFVVQVMAEVAGGPRPVLEARIFADVEPPQPGDPPPRREADRHDGESDEHELARLVSAARAAEGLRPFVVDPLLSIVARRHAQRMAQTKRLAHDAGDGSPVDRIRAAGLDVQDFGENVAHAATVAIAHEAIWSSPSHRANLVRSQFDRIGIAVVRDDRSEVWAVEELAAGL
ncbi:MAG: CAP domain-containing protein [Polyangiaceae bacterium]